MSSIGRRQQAADATVAIAASFGRNRGNQFKPKRPPATPKPVADDGGTSSNLGSGRISHKRCGGGGGGSGGSGGSSGSAELFPVAGADAGATNVTPGGAGTTITIPGTPGATPDAVGSSTARTGGMLWPTGMLARGGVGGSGSGGVGGNSRGFTPVTVGPSTGPVRLATPQQGGREVRS
ncbi:unnamed protein product [Ectocarpus sp. 12 AP-2014]